ncbi:MAG: hypothetical protein IKU79_01635 [Bacteroidaceae bacterium]|nr:hypothetical protein [Bacteroidaceae bacterium]
MKKGIIYKASLFMLASLSFGACSENDVVDYGAGGLQPLVISATPVETRTLLADDGKSIVWQSDDEIAVYDFVAPKHKFTLESSDRSKARFLGKITAKKDNFLALYPYSLGAENLTETNRISVQLPTQQTAQANTFASGLNISVGKGSRNVDGSPSVLTFYNVCQLLKFEVPEYISGKIKEIRFSTNTSVAGTMQVDYSASIPSASVSADGSPEITILPPSQATTFAPGTYYIVTAPVRMTGFSMSFTCDGKTYSLSSGSTFGGEAGKIYSLGKIDLVNTPSAHAVHVYNQGVLMGTKLSLSNAPFEGKEWSAVVKNANGTVVRSLQGTGNLTSSENDAAWPYLPQGGYTVEYSFDNSNGKRITKTMQFNVVEKPTFTVSTYAYTSFSYYKGDGVERDIETANSLHNMTIYEPRITINGIDSKILKSSNYTFTSQISSVSSSVKGRDGAVITYNNATVSNLGAYSLTGLVSFDGTSVSAVKTVYITGIPYNAEPPTQANGWTGSASWNSGYAQLNKQTISKSFYCSENINVNVIHSYNIPSSILSPAQYKLDCSGSAITIDGARVSATSAKNAANAMTLKTSNPVVSCQSTKGNVRVERIAVEYR